MLLELTGKKFGRWTVLRRDTKKPRGRGTWWIVKCSCPKKTIRSIRGCCLTKTEKASRSCGCLQREREGGAAHWRFRDLTGEVFGEWTVLHKAPPYRTKGGQSLVRWVVQCSCPEKTIRIKTGNCLRTGSSKSCGCSTVRFLKETLSRERALPPWRKGLSHVFTSCRQGAKKRKIEFKLARDEVYRMALEECFYCCRKPDPFRGVDRVDNKGIYESTNCVPCCVFCNRCKNARSLKDFAEYCQQLSENLTGVKFDDPEHVHKLWLNKLQLRNTSAVQQAA